MRDLPVREGRCQRQPGPGHRCGLGRLGQVRRHHRAEQERRLRDCRRHGPLPWRGRLGRQRHGGRSRPGLALARRRPRPAGPVHAAPGLRPNPALPVRQFGHAVPRRRWCSLVAASGISGGRYRFNALGRHAAAGQPGLQTLAPGRRPVVDHRPRLEHAPEPAPRCARRHPAHRRFVFLQRLSARGTGGSGDRPARGLDLVLQPATAGHTGLPRLAVPQWSGRADLGQPVHAGGGRRQQRPACLGTRQPVPPAHGQRRLRDQFVAACQRRRRRRPHDTGRGVLGADPQPAAGRHVAGPAGVVAARPRRHLQFQRQAHCHADRQAARQRELRPRRARQPHGEPELPCRLGRHLPGLAAAQQPAVQLQPGPL